MQNDELNRASGAGVATFIALAAGLAFTSTAYAEYPDKPVTLVVPYSAGGSTETLARVFSKALSDELGQPVIVKTRPGGGGAVGSTELAAATPDGYTIMMSGSDPLTWTPLTLSVEYDVDSFTYVAQISEYQQAIIVRADSPDQTFEDLIARSKATPGLTYADQNAMSRAFLEYIGKQESIDWTGIPTAGGGEMVPLLLAGKIDFAWSGGVHSRYGDQMRVLASMNADRLAASPDAPSIKEMYGIAMPGHMLVTGPKGLPDDVVAKLNTAIEAATKNQEYLDLLEGKLLFPSKFVGSAALTADIEATIENLKKIVGVAE
ncbi:MAG: tripartite tricarboxylate transporter substrate binding protein [Brucellaceae bacterium]|nr:tripartite tricarboxylate transporter substrate binding protein [Brucellaceae bacterium]